MAGGVTANLNSFRNVHANLHLFLPPANLQDGPAVENRSIRHCSVRIYNRGSHCRCYCDSVPTHFEALESTSPRHMLESR